MKRLSRPGAYSRSASNSAPSPFCTWALIAVDRLLHEELQRRAVHAAHIGQHVDGAIDRNAPDELDERRAGRASASRRVDDARARARRGTIGRATRAFSAGGKFADTISERSTCAALLGDQLESGSSADSGSRRLSAMMAPRSPI